MPKIVDHDQRRLELVSATWRIIAREGIEGATMRQIAVEAGFANGALKPYFPTKDQLLTFAFEHVFNLTSDRMVESTAGKTGLTALRIYCLEILPLDSQRIDEARVLIPFWQKGVTDPVKAEQHNRLMAVWRDRIREMLREARAAGEVSTSVTDENLIGALMTMLLGAQVSGVLSPEEHSPEQLVAQLDGFFHLLSMGRTRSEPTEPAASSAR